MSPPTPKCHLCRMREMRASNGNLMAGNFRLSSLFCFSVHCFCIMWKLCLLFTFFFFFYQFITADSLIIILIIIIIIGTILIIKTFWKETTIEPWERSAGELLASFTENDQRVKSNVNFQNLTEIKFNI